MFGGLPGVHGSVHCSRSWSVYVWVACWHNGSSEGWLVREKEPTTFARETNTKLPEQYQCHVLVHVSSSLT